MLLYSNYSYLKCQNDFLITYNFNFLPTKHTKITKSFFDRIKRIKRIRIQNQKFLLAEAKLSEIL